MLRARNSSLKGLMRMPMKGGSVPLLGVLSYASPIISTGLLMLLGLAAPTWALAVACLLMVVAAVVATRAG